MRMEWRHDSETEPSTFFIEVGDDNYEVRKVEIFKDGRSHRVGLNGADDIGLAQIPVDSIEEINLDPDFHAIEIDATYFETEWEKAPEATWS
ncbi:hypothetical protein DFR71_1533 [Nocardia alba]|uniref:DUF6881 domain-containing protein n=1 Tax=Nocardia alba TaxID=225051 RepID=A0A4R1G2R8_9NOCA|nr:hypothetical protein DFR71_1533 [Nocardia alba]